MTHTALRPTTTGLRIFTGLLLMIALAACSDTDNQPAATSLDRSENNSELTILALGDSLTEGLGVRRDMNYPSQLERHLQSHGYPTARVINAGVSGETSTGLLQRLDWVLSQEPDIVILTIGANDAMRALPLGLLKSNMTSMTEMILAQDARLILGGMQIYDNMGADYSRDFKNIYTELANEYQLPLIEFFLEGVAGIDALNNSDLIHPNADGYSMIVDQNILPILQPILEQMQTGKPRANLLEPTRSAPSEG